MRTRELLHAVDVSPGVPASSALVVLHGIYGRGRNWHAVARAIATRRPEWPPILVDLRGHGDSPAMAPPHTVATCAEDVRHLVEARSLRSVVVVGHSFSGKVALACLSTLRHVLHGVWVIDSTPAASPPTGLAWQMLDVVERQRGPFATRTHAIAALATDGVPSPVASWMASNLVHGDAGFRWGLDFEQCRALLADFFAQDLWSHIDRPPDDIGIHIVKARESDVLDGESWGRVVRASRLSENVRAHVLAGGHWLNVDNADGLVDLLTSELPTRGAQATSARA